MEDRVSILPNTNIEMPRELSRSLQDYSLVRNNEGNSQAVIFKCEKNNEIFYLKTEQSNTNLLKREYNILKWLSGRLPVPEVKYYGEHNGLSFILTTAIKGHKAKAGTANDEIRKPYENTVKLLADGLLMFQSIDISDCPFTHNFNVNFQNTVYNAETSSYYPDYIDRKSVV
jgi:aminoglycoside phosphotransferase